MAWDDAKKEAVIEKPKVEPEKVALTKEEKAKAATVEQLLQ